MNNVILRPYQEECLRISEEKLSKNIRRQLIVSATGTGKRLLAVERSKSFTSTLFIAHREELIEQAVAEFDLLYPGQVGVIKGPRFELDNKIVICSAQTIHRRLDKIPENRFEYIAVDEAHHFVATTFIKPLQYFNPILMQGFTATPTRLDGLNFSNIFDEIIFTYDIHEAIEDGWLCELDATRIKTKIDLSQVHRVAGDFNQKELSMHVDIPERNDLIVEKYLQYANDRQGIVFCVDIEHSKNMAKAFNDNGISCMAIHSLLDSEERRDINRRFKKKEIQVLTNVEILTEGWDYFDVGVIMMARPTQSLAMYMQMIGRGTRLKSVEFIEEQFNIDIRKDADDNWIDINKITYKNKGYTFFLHRDTPFLTNDEREFINKYYIKGNCKILDFVDNCGKHSLINTWEIDKVKCNERKTFVTSEKREQLIFQEKQRREAIIKNAYRSDKNINLFLLPEIRINHTGRMLELATEPQLNWLKALGVWQEGVEYTKGQASELITRSPAQSWQLRYLVEWGYDVTNGATQGQYYQIKMERQSMNQNTSTTPFRM